MKKGFSILQITLFMVIFIFLPVQASTYLENLQPDQNIHGFSTANLYVNGTDKVMGARFISEKYGFIIDLMEIQSVPQGFFWIKTPPESDKGLSHTCEHLLLGKGNRGRYVAVLEEMSLGSSSAYTAQVRTCYHFNTIAGGETFYKILEAKLMAFLHPDFTDEEIRREVCHIGVTLDTQTGVLSLEEKGTVYTEMVSAFEKPWYYYYNTMLNLLYGKGHPLSYVSGGIPAALRTLTPEDLWKFHNETHHLANMGMITSIPDDMPLDSFLKRMKEILENCQKTPTSSEYVGISEYPLPKPRPAHYGVVKLVTYPSEIKQSPGNMYFCWPAHLELDNRQKILLNLFLTAFSEGSTSNLFDLFINSETRKINLGGNNVWRWAPDYQGNPIWIALVGLDNLHINELMVDSVRSMITNEIRRVYDFADGSEDLIEFNREVESHLVQMRKEKENYLNSPPMFGFRSFVSSGWISNIGILEKDKDFCKSLVLKHHFAYAESLLATGENFWKDLIDQWKLLTVTPYAVGSSPDPAMLRQMKEEKAVRIVGYINDLMEKYGVNDDQEAIARYGEEFDKKTEELEKIATEQELPGFIDNPPMTLDDQLKYETIKLSGNVPLVASTFDNMNSSTIGIALRLDVIPESLLVYVPSLPDILTSIGVIEDGRSVPYKEMQERLRKEVLRFNADFDYGLQTGRIELILYSAGSNTGELKNALNWMKLSLYSPYLSPDNLMRMTDVIDQTLISLRNTMKGSEEDWVSYPAYAYMYQTNPLFMSTNTFLTKVHHFHRLRCMLTDPGTADEQKELIGFIDALALYGKDKSRSEMIELLTALMNAELEGESGIMDFNPKPQNLSETAKYNAQFVIKAIKASLSDIPDANLHDDWVYLCRETKRDMLVKPEKAIADIKTVLNLICRADNARMFMISNSDDRNSAFEEIKDFVGQLDNENVSVRQQYDDTERIIERLRSRVPGIKRPVYVGLVHEGTRNGVIIHSARYASEYDTTKSSVMDYLSGKLYSGGGGHSIFMRTWSAGLAYSNGIWVNETNGRVNYYAERCPDVAETMGFVVDELKNAKDAPNLVDYAIAQVFSRSRAASRYEARGQAIAADLADGYTPERVELFRSNVMKVCEMDGLYEELVKRMERVYGKVLIGYGEPLAKSPDRNFFLIGPEIQFKSLESYIENTEGKQTIYRLYPRDFWLLDLM